MIRKLRESWFIFKNAKYKFNEDKNAASELVEKASHLKCITKEAWIKNKEFVDFVKTNLEKYPNGMHEYLKGLVSLLSSSDLDNYYIPYVCTLFDIYLKCNDYHTWMKQKFENNDFERVKEYYGELINALKRFEKQFNIKILDNSYRY